MIDLKTKQDPDDSANDKAYTYNGDMALVKHGAINTYPLHSNDHHPHIKDKQKTGHLYLLYLVVRKKPDRSVSLQVPTKRLIQTQSMLE